jgi:hypothetical protein
LRLRREPAIEPAEDGDFRVASQFHTDDGRSVVTAEEQLVVGEGRRAGFHTDTITKTACSESSRDRP